MGCCCIAAAEPKSDQKIPSEARGTQNAGTDKRGTQDAPLFVNAHSVQSDKETADEASKVAEQKSVNRWNIGLTFAIAICAFLQFCGILAQVFVYLRQTKIMTDTLSAISSQAATMARQAKDARDAAASDALTTRETLKAINRQGDIMAGQLKEMEVGSATARESADAARVMAKASSLNAIAAEKSAEVALAQIKAMKAKERGRLVVELASFSPFRYSGPISSGSDFVRVRVRLYGITDVSEVYSSCFVCIGDPKGSAESIFGVENMPLAPIISTDGRINEADIPLRLNVTDTDHSPLCYEAVWAGEISVFCEGFVMYRDIFEDRWVTSFKKMWQFYPNWKDRPEGERGHWMIKDGDEDQNREEPVKSEIDPGAN